MPNPHLTPEQIEVLEQDLMSELLRLERSMGVSELATEVVELDQTAVGRLSRMNSLQSQSMAKNLKEREAVKLALLIDALKRIEQGTYGLCVECGGHVSFGRLSVLPESGECSGCAS